jgi:hypothetical protein
MLSCGNVFAKENKNHKINQKQRDRHQQHQNLKMTSQCFIVKMASKTGFRISSQTENNEMEAKGNKT